MPRYSLDHDILTAALVGLEARREQIEQQIAEIRRRVGPRRQPAAQAAAAAQEAPRRKRRRMSAAARKRIADAQKKRWAEFRKRSK